MKETSTDKPSTIRFWKSHSKAHGERSTSNRPGHDRHLNLPLSNTRTNSLQTVQSAVPANNSSNGVLTASPDTDGSYENLEIPSKTASHNDTAEGDGLQSAASPPSGQGGQLETEPSPKKESKKNKNKDPLVKRFYLTCKKILFYTWINVLLVFVPIGIIVEFTPDMSPGVVFAMNAIAIIPLASLLSHATETVAHRMGDAIGALCNITFGNAVELIIFIIALVKNEVRIVQASLLGSVLANLLLILGMSFLLGGLRFREQIYNSTVTQMSACLLSLSVISLVLPTAFHASFSDSEVADRQSIKISRGTSVVLLLVYVIYLLFQLKSHAYMYEGTPQNVIDAETQNWSDSSSSDSSSSSSSDSDSSGRSRETVSKRMKRVIRGGRRRKSSVASVETAESSIAHRTSSFGTATASPTTEDEDPHNSRLVVYPRLNIADGDESPVEDEKPRRKHRRKYRRYRKHSKKPGSHGDNSPSQETIDEVPENAVKTASNSGEPRRVDFAVNNSVASVDDGTAEVVPARNPFTALRGLAPTVFIQSPEARAMPVVPTGPVPRVRYGIRRTNSLPDRLNNRFRPPGAMPPARVPFSALASGVVVDEDEDKYANDLSRTSAILLLLISTGLVAVCAEGMVGAINGLVESSTVSEAFIGLIILPLVGNAAEHVTAVKVAMKNKMDLAIGVAVGSSIQIALFITPLVVILGWIMNVRMTLFFTLFETVCLFVSAFIANFLVLDGRSNYLEGALLCATYVIISIIAFYFPNPEEASAWGA